MSAPENRPFEDLPGEVTVTHAHGRDHWSPRGREAVLVRQDLGPVKVAAWVPFSTNMLEDLRSAGGLNQAIEAATDRHFRPWRYPDRNPVPELDLFPRVTAARVRVRLVRQRLADAVHVARHGLPEEY